jgi:hypothetical protein
MPSLVFRDSLGTVTIPSTVPTFGNWVPDVDEIGDRQTGLGTGDQFLFGYRTDYIAAFEMPNIPALALGDLVRMKRWLLRGGLLTVNTDDAASRVFTVKLRAGTTPSWTLADRRLREYTLTLEVCNVAPYPMLVDYSRIKGPTQNLIVNGGGETGTVGAQAPNWAVTTGSGLLVASDEVFTGIRSLSITNSVAASSQNTQTGYAMAAGQRYFMSGWIKTSAISNGAGDGAFFDAFNDGGSSAWTVIAHSGTLFFAGEPDVGVPADGVAHDWTFVWSLFTSAVSGTMGIRVRLRTLVAGAGQAWYDGVRLEPVPSA